MRRRDLLLLSAGAVLAPLGTGAWAAAGSRTASLTGSLGGQRLVVVLLRGAVDGLNTVVPYGEEAYYAARPTIAIAKPDAAEGASLALDGHFALHPALAATPPARPIRAARISTRSCSSRTAPPAGASPPMAG